MVASPNLLCCPTTLRDLFRFLLVFPLVRLVKMAFFFFFFFLLENNFKREQRTTPDTAPQSEQRLRFTVVQCQNHFLKFLKMVFEDIINVGIQRCFFFPCQLDDTD